MIKVKNQHQANLVISLLIAGVSLALVLTFYTNFVWPIEQHEREKFLAECEEKGYTCTAEPGFTGIILPVIPFMIFTLVYSYLEQRRKKTWRSYR